MLRLKHPNESDRVNVMDVLIRGEMINILKGLYLASFPEFLLKVNIQEHLEKIPSDCSRKWAIFISSPTHAPWTNLENEWEKKENHSRSHDVLSISCLEIFKFNIEQTYKNA